MLTPVALGYLVFLQVTGRLTFGHLGWEHTLLLIASGLVTVVPLLFFAAATTRLPLSTLGLLQYIAPTLQFLLGVLYFGEEMSVGPLGRIRPGLVGAGHPDRVRHQPGPAKPPPRRRAGRRTGLTTAYVSGLHPAVFRFRGNRRVEPARNLTDLRQGADRPGN